jgi:hypothetical protein
MHSLHGSHLLVQRHGLSHVIGANPVRPTTFPLATHSRREDTSLISVKDPGWLATAGRHRARHPRRGLTGLLFPVFRAAMGSAIQKPPTTTELALKERAEGQTFEWSRDEKSRHVRLATFNVYGSRGLAARLLSSRTIDGRCGIRSRKYGGRGG